MYTETNRKTDKNGHFAKKETCEIRHKCNHGDQDENNKDKKQKEDKRDKNEDSSNDKCQETDKETEKLEQRNQPRGLGQKTRQTKMKGRFCFLTRKLSPRNKYHWQTRQVA